MTSSSCFSCYAEFHHTSACYHHPSPDTYETNPNRSHPITKSVRQKSALSEQALDGSEVSEPAVHDTYTNLVSEIQFFVGFLGSFEEVTWVFCRWIL